MNKKYFTDPRTNFQIYIKTNTIHKMYVPPHRRARKNGFKQRLVREIRNLGRGESDFYRVTSILEKDNEIHVDFFSSDMDFEVHGICMLPKD